MEHKDIGGLEFTVGEPKERGEGIKPLEEDTFYNAVIPKFEKTQTSFGEMLRWIFELTDPEYEYEFTDDNGDVQKRRRRVTALSSMLCNPKTKLYKWYSKIIGKEPGVGERVKLSNIINKECLIMIKNVKGKKANEDGTFPVFSNVERISTKKGKKGKSSKPKYSKKIKSKEEPEKDEDLFDDIF